MKMYSGKIEYAHHSAYIFGGTNLDEVSKTMEEGIKFYQGNNETIREATIEAFCDKCNNTGEYRVYRKHNHLICKMKKCECEMKYIDEKIIVNIPVLS